MRTWVNSQSIESKLKRARAHLDGLEITTLRVFGKFGLPTINGRYRRPAKGGDWEYVQKFSLKEASDPAWRHARLVDIAKQEFPADSQVGFAVSIMESIEAARDYLNAAERTENWLAVTLFASGVNIAQAVGGYREEFTLGDLIAPTKGQIEGRRSGGNITAAKTKAERERAWRRWQACADQIWMDRPALTKTAVARLVRSKLTLTERADTVTRRIEKSGSS
ncbi:MAG: hypothetical protein ACK4SE_03270 [Brevundimonas sp.]